MKAHILEAIGERDLSGSAGIDAALAANDRLKYCLSLLQMAVARADHPEQPLDSLRRERLASGIENPALDRLMTEARRENGRYKLPGYPAVLQQIVQDLRVMAAPVLAGNGAPGQHAGFQARLEGLLPKLEKSQEDLIDATTVRDLTSAEAGGLHQLVMDLHKALNAMQAELAEEHVDGASVYHLEDCDRPLVSAFMSGLNRTAPLKFHHPGLGTTATRAGTRLIIQNDLGTTDAHVIVIHVEGLTVHITHTDIHPERIEFLREMLKRYGTSWGDERNQPAESALGGVPFYLVTGRFDAKDSGELLAYLEFLGSRLVFLIDWNRARKQLRGFLRGKDRIALLGWAADAEVGHRGFLELGGAQLINRAIEDSGASAMHFGDRLCDVLGTEASMEFLRFVFRAAMEGLRDHQSASLIRDRVRAELQAHFSTEGRRLLLVAGEHAALIFEIATLARDGVRSIQAGDRAGSYERLARRASAYEHSADQLVAQSRDAVQRRPEYSVLFRLLETADNAADELEEVAFLIELLAESESGGPVLEALGALADLLVEAAQEWVKAVSHASRVDKPLGAGAQDDVSDFLTSVDALFALEHRADDAERALTRAAVQRARDFRQLHIYSKMAHSLEEASDALKWSGLIARDYLLGNTAGLEVPRS